MKKISVWEVAKVAVVAGILVNSAITLVNFLDKKFTVTVTTTPNDSKKAN